jgi:hypothetical protein
MGEEGGGDDGEEIFGEQCRRDVGDILGVLSDGRFEAFWIALRTECLKIRRGIETTPNSFTKVAPFDATLTQRVQWLNANVLNPIQKLKAAIAVDNHPYFNHWETYGKVEAPTTKKLVAELNQLEIKASQIAKHLNGERTGKGPSGKLSHNDEIRHYIVFTAIHEVREHFPEIKLVRGNWDKDVGNMTGAVPDYVRRVFLETTGQNETLNGQLQFVISDL